jgi:VanZ family protein
LRGIARRWLPVVAMMAVIFFFSSRPIPAQVSWVPDWISHPAAYGLLGWLFARARGRRGPAAVLAAVVFCVLYGVTDEYHQSFVPTRSPDVWDIVKDAIGASLGSSLWALDFRPPTFD